ncbi:hypothetical protein Patl1_11715 [Pistacia atlantica]|uniref:Uncharacterized protein n=1 Tax=Pistacia atlantica TaxID=434234 RepID=A0ACC1A5M4_9ROSI|nr:hypothetical protein Patl1_11715 [Pistacia atlantica]
MSRCSSSSSTKSWIVHGIVAGAAIAMVTTRREETIISAIAEQVLGKLISLASNETCLACGVKNDAQELADTLTTIKAVLLDAKDKQIHNETMKVWLGKLKEICYDTEDVLDEIEVEELRKQVEKLESNESQAGLMEIQANGAVNKPCSGAAIKTTSLEDYNPAIQCDCSFQNGSTCHITELRKRDKIKLKIPSKLLMKHFIFVPPPSHALSSLSLSNCQSVTITGVTHRRSSPELQSSQASSQHKSSRPVRALNSTFQRWDVQADPRWWNISAEPCSGAAINAASLEDYNPATKCDCSFENGSTWHITDLSVFAMDIKGAIPEELVALQFLTNFRIKRNYFTDPLPAFIGNLSQLKYLEVGQSVLSKPLPKELGNLKNLTFL